MDCPIPNRCHSKIPDLTGIPLPLTESESRHQRAMILAAAKSTLTNQTDENQSVGTAVNPRERPRGMLAPSGSLLNFNPKTIPLVVPPPLPPPPQLRSTQQRSGSAAQLYV